MMCKTVEARISRIGFPLLLSSLLAISSGCSGGRMSSGSAGQYNTYAGTQSVTLTEVNGSPAAGGVWSLTLDDNSDYFSYENDGFYSSVVPPSIGSFAASSSFLDLTLNGKSSGSGGYAIEVPGSAALFRPGDDTNFPVVAVAANSCPGVQANTTFQFVALGHSIPSPQNASPYPAYGSVQASAQGAAWTFSNLSTYTVDGTSLNPSAIPAGTCGYTQEGYVISVPTSQQTGNVPITAAVGATGFFMIDLGQGSKKPSASGLVGVAQPLSQLDTGNIVAGKYIGFEYVPLENALGVLGSGGTTSVSLGATTAPVAFGQTAGSGSVMTGGAYPNDNIAQTPPSDISIDLGAQDAKNNGLYKSVTVTIPDPTGSCVSRPYGSTDANGNPICVFPGVAVAGNPNSKFALFVTANDERAATFSYAQLPIEFFLYQQ